jgi:hypothetical protein
MRELPHTSVAYCPCGREIFTFGAVFISEQAHFPPETVNKIKKIQLKRFTILLRDL